MKRTQLSILVLIFFGLPAFALEPPEVVLLANKNMPDSIEVAEHFRRMRKVPPENLILLDLPVTEDISRKDYDAKIVGPVRAALNGRKNKIKVLLCVYGVPLRVGGPEPNARERAELARIQPEVMKSLEKVKQLEAKIKEFQADAAKDGNSPAATELARIRDELKNAQAEQRRLDRRRRFLSHAESQAAVDNELMLLWWENYELRRFVINPLHFQVPEQYRAKHAAGDDDCSTRRADAGNCKAAG